MTLGILEEKLVVIFSGEREEVEDKINNHFETYHKARLIDIKYSVTKNDNGRDKHHALVIFTERGG